MSVPTNSGTSHKTQDTQRESLFYFIQHSALSQQRKSEQIAKPKMNDKYQAVINTVFSEIIDALLVPSTGMSGEFLRSLGTSLPSEDGNRK